MGNRFRSKCEALERFVSEKGCNGVVVAFSGGLDSSTLIAVCHNQLGEKTVAVTAKSPINPPGTVETAARIARGIGVEHLIVETRELLNKNFVENRADRCYHCKKGLLKELCSLAEKLGFGVVFEGTNLTELSEHRPGFKAVLEIENVFSPFVETGFTRGDVELLAKKMGLPTLSKHPESCLASRIPFGEPITAEKLWRIGEAERVVKRVTGVELLRVRTHGDLARIEIGRSEREKMFNTEKMDRISVELKKLGFRFVVMDLEGYKTGGANQS